MCRHTLTIRKDGARTVIVVAKVPATLLFATTILGMTVLAGMSVAMMVIVAICHAAMRIVAICHATMRIVARNVAPRVQPSRQRLATYYI